MEISFVDAFTDKPFAGNPAAVVLLEGHAFPTDRQMQRLAAQINLSETAFAHRLPEGAEADWALRWFTPACEVRMCGHATLATRHVVNTTTATTGRVRFATLSGVLSATASETGVITMDFPTAPLTEVSVPAPVTEALGGVPVKSAWMTGPDVGDILLEVDSEQAVRTLVPDLSTLAALGTRGAIVTAPAEHTGAEYDFVSRCFFPGSGVDEDPVTGSAHTALAPFWAGRLARQELTGLQASARTGLVRTEVRGDRTLLSGSAVTVMRAELCVPL